MFPTLFKIGNFEITTFGLMMFLAFAFGGWLLAKELRRKGLSDELASSMVLFGAIGGIVGAKIYYAILYRDFSLLFSRAGLVYYGGLIGGGIGVWIALRRARVPFLVGADAIAPPLAIGYAIGRMGCFLVGDDYGRPTDSVVGIAFPKGAPPTTAESLRDFGVAVDPSLPPWALLKVHPTQLYEVAGGIVMFIILRRMARRPHADGKILGWFFVLLGLERFLVEFLRAKDDRFLGPFTIAQLISVIMMVIGTWLIGHARSRSSDAHA